MYIIYVKYAIVKTKIFDIFYLRSVKKRYVKRILQKKTTILNYF